jgi:two-component system, chemotaxis family, chemotaxis protein CheY
MKHISRFLIIDDDPGSNMLCEILIKRISGNTDIQTFTEPEAAMDFIENKYSGNNGVPTVIFLDINMPGMTGWDVLEKFATFDDSIIQKVTIYMVSSSVDERDKNQATKNPFVADYFEKPLNSDKLNKVLGRTI